MGVFSLHDRGSWAHGHLVAGIGFKATASLHRGIDLSAELDAAVEGRLSTELAKAVRATFGLGGDLQAGLALQAACPLDLFSGQAGIVARLQVEAEAAAWVEAQVALELIELRDLVADAFPPVWAPVVDAFLSEARINAGLFAKASASAELVAQAILTGSFVADSDAALPAGFTCSISAAAGIALGTGFETRVNVGFDDPLRLLDRVGGAIVDAVVAAASDTPHAVPYLRLLLPVTVRSSMELGLQLGRGASVDEAAAAVCRRFVAGAQSALLHAVFSLAADHASRQIAGAIARLEAMTADEVRGVAEAATPVRAAVAAASISSSFDIDAWCGVGLDLVSALEEVTATPLVADADREEWARYLALGWAALVVLRRVLAATGTQPSDGTPAEMTHGQVVGPYVAQRLGKAAGETLTIADAAAFIVLDDVVPLLRNRFPELAGFLDWLAGAVEADAAPLMTRLVVDLGRLSQADLLALLPGLSAAITDAVERFLIPEVLDPLAAADPGWHWANEGILKPLLRGVDAVILPGLQSVREGGDAQPVREQLSALLFQLPADILLEAIRQVSHVALRGGSQATRDLVVEIRNGQAGALVGAVGAAIGASPLAILAPDARDIADLLGLAADAMTLADAQLVDPNIDLVATIIGVGLRDGFNLLDSLANPAVIPDLDRLKQLCATCCDGDLALLALVASNLGRCWRGTSNGLADVSPRRSRPARRRSSRRSRMP